MKIGIKLQSVVLPTLLWAVALSVFLFLFYIYETRTMQHVLLHAQGTHTRLFEKHFTDLANRAAQAITSLQAHQESAPKAARESAANPNPKQIIESVVKPIPSAEPEVSTSKQQNTTALNSDGLMKVLRDFAYIEKRSGQQIYEVYSTLSDADEHRISVRLNPVVDQVLEQAANKSLIVCVERCFHVFVSAHAEIQGSGSVYIVVQDIEAAMLETAVIAESSVGIVQMSSGASRGVTYYGDDLPVETIAGALLTVAGQQALQTDSIFPYQDQRFSIRLVALDHVGLAPEFLSFFFVSDVTEEYELMRRTLGQAAVFSLLVLVLNGVLVLLYVNRAVDRISQVSEALLLLPKKRFREALRLLSMRSGWISDETTGLERSAMFVTRELSNLHDDIDTKSLMLQEQVMALRHSRSFLSRIFDNADVFIVTQYLDGQVFNVNKRAGFLGDVVGAPFISLFTSTDEAAAFNERMEHLKNKSLESFYQESGVRTRSAGDLIVRWTHTLVEDEKGNEVILSIGMDYTKQKSAEDNLRWLANHDSLTALGNRRSFNETLSKLIDSHRRFIIVFVDVNKFKVVNDVYGHSAGDCVLIDIASQLKKSISKSDFVFRLAGDEFTVLIKNNGVDSLELLSGLSRDLERTVETYDGKNVPYSVSIGAARYPDHGSTLEELLVNADMAMYHAKRKGHGRWHMFDINDDHASQVREETKLLLDVRRAIRLQRFSLVYQPILEIGSEKTNHYEALIRLKDSAGREISPSRFVPLAEKYGEIRAIDEWVIDHALADLRRYAEENPGLTFSINVSAPTLQSADFPAMVFYKIFTHRVDPASIVIELTETAYIENFNQVQHNLNELAVHGVRIALDDFGVGFSSFNYLKQLPLTYVKLDGSYVRNLISNKDDQVFVKSLNAMINAFSMYTVAEFVEDGDTLALLKDLGVDYAQGYYICEPRPILAIVNSPAATNA